MMQLFRDPSIIAFVHALAWTLLNFLWQGCVLACVFAALVHAARHRSANTRYIIGCGILTAMAIAPIVTFALLWKAAPQASTTSVSLTPAASSAAVSMSLLAVVLVWTLGALICAMWLTGGLLQTVMLRRLPTVELADRTRVQIEQIATLMRVRAAVRVVDSTLATIPMTIGWISPVILLPAATLAGLSCTQLKAILAHELAHIRRWDYLVNVLQRVVESLLFFHPAVWWVSSRIRQEREYCCDDIAAEVCGDRVVYARALADLESLRSVRAQLALSSQGGSLMKRITRLLNIPTPTSPRTARPLTAMAAIITLTGASAAFAIAHRPQQANQDAQAEAVLEIVTEDYEDALGTYVDCRAEIELIEGDELHFGHELHLEVVPIVRVLNGACTDESSNTLLLWQPELQLHEHVDPLTELIESERLMYPWDIFDLFLGTDTAPAVSSDELNHEVWIATGTELQAQTVTLEIQLQDDVNGEGQYLLQVVPVLSDLPFAPVEEEVVVEGKPTEAQVESEELEFGEPTPE